MTDNNMESSVSAYVAKSYEGLDTAFSEVSQLPSRGYCDLYRVKRFLFGEVLSISFWKKIVKPTFVEPTLI